MTARYSTRRAEACSASVSSTGLLEHAKVLNLSAPGCLLETSLPLRAGEYVQVLINHVEGQPPLLIDLAAVRWVNGGKAGLEFIRMSREDEARLRRHVGMDAPVPGSTAGWSETIMWPGATAL